MDGVYWCQCKNCGAFLLRMPGEGLFGHFHAAEHVPHADPLNLRAPLTAHGTEGGRADRGEEGGYTTEGGGVQQGGREGWQRGDFG